jgi:hypothetical protein
MLRQLTVLVLVLLLALAMSSAQPKEPAASDAPQKKGRGRPPGAKNKAKPTLGANPFAIAESQASRAGAAGAAGEADGANAAGANAAGAVAVQEEGGGVGFAEQLRAGGAAGGEPAPASAQVAANPIASDADCARSPAQLAFFAKVRAEVGENIGLKGHGDQHGRLSSTYVFESLWFEPEDAVLRSGPSPPEDFYVKKVFLVCWEYLRGVTKPCCPECGSEKNVTREGWDPLGRKVYGEHENYFLMGYQYKCKDCNHWFAPWDPKTVQKLPREYQIKFPCVVLPRSALDKKVLNMLEPELATGNGFKTIESRLKENYMNQYHETEDLYYSHISRRRNLNVSGQLVLFGEQLQLVREPRKFSTFGDRGGYDGTTPSDTLLEAAWFMGFELREYWYHRQQQLVGGQVLSGDGAHKLVKGVRLLNVKVVYGIFTVLNEFNQVVLQRPMAQDAVGSIAELEEDLARLAERYKVMGFAQVLVWYTDNCCADRPVVQRAFKLHCGADRQAVAASAAANIAPVAALAFPSDTTPARILTNAANMQVINKACASLIESASTAANKNGLAAPVLGVRIIWDASVLGKPDPVAVLIASVDGTAFFFHIKSAQKHSLPASLVDLLENTNVVKVGFNMTTDAQYLRESAGIDVTPLEHLPTYAVRMAPSWAADGTAAGMCASVLQRTLPEQAPTAMTWMAPRLPDALVAEACLVPFAACWVYQRILAHADPIHRPGPRTAAEITSGERLRLYGKTNTVCIAEGTVQEYTAERWGSTAIVLNAAAPRAGDDGGGATAARQRTRERAQKHVVVQITKIHIPNALSRNMCPDGKRRTLAAIGAGQLALWDVVSIIITAVYSCESSHVLCACSPKLGVCSRVWSRWLRVATTFYCICGLDFAPPWLALPGVSLSADQCASGRGAGDGSSFAALC